MPVFSLKEITRENWREALQLTVHPEQQHFVADYVPIASIMLAKAYVRPGGFVWVPYGIYANREMVGMVELAYQPAASEQYWMYHFFIDRAHQGKGYGKQALRTVMAYLRQQYADCQQLFLSVRPDNSRALQLYTSQGFHPTGAYQDGEPVYCLSLG